MKLDYSKLLGYKLSNGGQVTGAKLGNVIDPKGKPVMGAKLAIDIKKGAR